MQKANEKTKHWSEPLQTSSSEVRDPNPGHQHELKPSDVNWVIQQQLGNDLILLPSTNCSFLSDKHHKPVLSTLTAIKEEAPTPIIVKREHLGQWPQHQVSQMTGFRRGQLFNHPCYLKKKKSPWGIGFFKGWELLEFRNTAFQQKQANRLCVLVAKPGREAKQAHIPLWNHFGCAHPSSDHQVVNPTLSTVSDTYYIHILYFPCIFIKKCLTLLLIFKCILPFLKKFLCLFASIKFPFMGDLLPPLFRVSGLQKVSLILSWVYNQTFTFVSV